MFFHQHVDDAGNAVRNNVVEKNLLPAVPLQAFLSSTLRGLAIHSARGRDISNVSGTTTAREVEFRSPRCSTIAIKGRDIYSLQIESGQGGMPTYLLLHARLVLEHS
jgi:hypothetical protein